MTREKSETRRLIVFALQAGCAHAFIPVIQRLQSASIHLQPSVFGAGAGLRAFEKAGIDVQASSSLETLQTRETVRETSMVLTGTSDQPQSNARFWCWARDHDIPSVAFVDHWVNYRRRFSSTENGELDLMPHRVAAIDVVMRDRLIEKGLDPNRVFVAGDPRHGRLKKSAMLSHQTARERCGFDVRHEVVVFISEPLTQVYETPIENLGYNEFTTLRRLVDFVSEDNGQRTDRSVRLLVKRHPREDSDKYIELVDDAAVQRLEVDMSRVDRHHLVRGADLVVGMTSTLLYEASLLGTPAISFRPHRRHSSDLVDLHDGILVADSASELGECFRRARNNVLPETRTTPLVDDSNDRDPVGTFLQQVLDQAEIPSRL